MSLLACVPQMLERHMQAYVHASQAAAQPAARQHASVVLAALGTLSSFADWAPMGRLSGGSVVEACAYFLAMPDFRTTAVDVLKQVGGAVLGEGSWGPLNLKRWQGGRECLRGSAWGGQEQGT